MPWWVDAAYVVGVMALFIVFDLIAKAVDRLWWLFSAPSASYWESPVWCIWGSPCAARSGS